MPLAPNVVRLDTQAAGLLFTGKVASTTMRRAAEITIAEGLHALPVRTGLHGPGPSEYGGSITTGNANWGNHSLNASAFSTPTYIPTAGVAVTVIMLKSDDPRATDAFVARDVLAEVNGKGSINPARR